MNESPIIIPCGTSSLCGMLHLPGDNEIIESRGVLIVVGGPQYRVGSHRQFVLLARHLAVHGVPVLRFDYRGMGDSEGEMYDFEFVGTDIRCAVDMFFRCQPLLKEVVIWGLCDAASAASFYAHQDERITGLILLNPWVRTEKGRAKARLKHYYWSRLLDPGLWRKIFGGDFQYKASAQSLISMLSSAFGLNKQSVSEDEKAKAATPVPRQQEPLPERMLAGLNKFQGRKLFVLSGDDIIADEFRDLVNASRQWRKLLNSDQVTQKTLLDANHTFSRRVWRDKVADWSTEWLKSDL